MSDSLGIGLQVGSHSTSESKADITSTTNSYLEKDFTQSKIGYHLLVEYDYIFDFGLTLFGGIKGKYMKFDGFKEGGATFYYGTKKVDIEAGLTGVALYIGAGYSF